MTLGLAMTFWVQPRAGRGRRDRRPAEVMSPHLGISGTVTPVAGLALVSLRVVAGSEFIHRHCHASTEHGVWGWLFPTR